MKTNLRPLLAALLLCCLIPLPLHAGAPVNALELAALLLRDGHPQRALSALAEQDPQDPGVDRVRYHTLQGLAHLRLSHFPQARTALEQALVAAAESGEAPSPRLYLHLARAAYALEDHRAVVDALERAGALLSSQPALQLIYGRSLWALGRHEAAWQSLVQAQRQHPDDPRFPRQRLAWLIESGLYQQAGELGVDYLRRLAQGPRDYLAVADALRRGGGVEAAILLLEQARLRYPGDAGLWRLLGQLYLSQGQRLTAAELYRRAAEIDPRYLHEAAELYRRAGHLHLALYLNMGVSDQRAKMRQRLGLLLELGRFDQAAAMAPTLRRLHLLEDDAVRYALAYAYFKTQRLTAAERILQGIRQGPWFQKATALHAALARCREDELACA